MAVGYLCFVSAGCFGLQCPLPLLQHKTLALSFLLAASGRKLGRLESSSLARFDAEFVRRQMQESLLGLSVVDQYSRLGQLAHGHDRWQGVTRHPAELVRSFANALKLQRDISGVGGEM